MRAKELAKELMKNPDFEIVFTISDGFAELPPHFPNIRTFKNVVIGDIGYSSKVIRLGATEDVD